jgi:hypothetical protein
MTEVPKIVHDRLRAASIKQGTGPAPHLDENLLAAFAEQALSAFERDGVIEHLAICGDCREVVALALPAAGIAAAPIAVEAEEAQRMWRGRTRPRDPGPTFFAWPRLRWAALAAGVALAGSVLLMRPWKQDGKQNVATLPPAAQQVAVISPPAFAPQVTPSPAESSPAKLSADLPATLARADGANLKEGANLKSELQLSNKARDRKALSPSAEAFRGALVGGALVAGKQPMPAAGGHPLDMPASRVPSEAIEVSAADATVAPVAAPSVEGRLMARNEAPSIAKAKPVPPDLEGNDLKKTSEKTPEKTKTAAVSGAAARQGGNFTYAASLTSSASKASASNATWMIAAGVLQRSFDGGQSWQSVLHADHSLLCYASHDQDVWAGGQAGTLFHSSDGGANWVPVQPSIQRQTLSSDVTGIELRGELRGASEIVVSTNSEVWSSADAGKTWSITKR